MFNRKLLNVLAYILAALLLVKLVLVLVMYVWAFFEPPPLVLFPPGADHLVNAILLVQEVGTIIFFFVVVAALKALTTCSCHIDLAGAAKKAMEGPIKTVRRVARKTRRRTTKKK